MSISTSYQLLRLGKYFEIIVLGLSIGKMFLWAKTQTFLFCQEKKKTQALEYSAGSLVIILLPVGLALFHAVFFFFFLRWGKFSLTGEVHSYHKLQDTLLLSLSGLLLFDLLAQKQLSIPLFKCPQNEEDKPPNRQNNNFHWGEKINILPISSSYCPQHICKTVCPE